MGEITRVAGNGDQGNSGDGGPATGAELSFTAAVAVTADGGYLITDSGNDEVRKVSAAGIITRVAGNGTKGNGGDGGPATQAQLNSPGGVAVTADGGFLIADNGNNVVRQVSAAGIITRVAGNGAQGDSGDGGPATDAKLKGPFGVAVTPTGFLIADSVNYVVRSVSYGVISRVAGNGIPGYSGDGGPATSAELNGPAAIAVTADNGFLISDVSASVVRKVSAAGIITTVAGNGTQGYSGDGGPATSAQLFSPVGLEVTADGGFLVADSFNNVVRKVSAAGIITTVAGNGTQGNSGDGGPATEAQLTQPYGVAVTLQLKLEGEWVTDFLIADAGNYEVRLVSGLVRSRFPVDPALPV
jgi:hypothetical protein